MGVVQVIMMDATGVCSSYKALGVLSSVQTENVLYLSHCVIT